MSIQLLRYDSFFSLFICHVCVCVCKILDSVFFFFFNHFSHMRKLRLGKAE